MATNLALQLQVIEPDTDLNSIMIGNFRYSDDVWDLRPFITAKTTKESQKYIRFEYISDADMKKTVKQYAYVCMTLDEVIAPMEMAASFIIALITSQKYSFIQS